MKHIETRDTLAESRRCRVEICNSEIIHIQSGNITIHLSINDFKDLSTVVSDAVDKFEALDEHNTDQLYLVYSREQKHE
ncbi:MAG: hypothetical protein ACON4U_16670 [Myxococcota bacterium]